MHIDYDLLEDMHILRTNCVGSQGTIFSANYNGTLVFVKRLNRQRRVEDLMFRCSLRHENIIKLW